MALSSSLQTALDAGKAPLWLFEAQLPDETTRYGDASVGTQGQFERVLEWGDLEEELSDPKSGELFHPTFQLTVPDRGDRFRKLMRSAYARQVKGTTGVLYLAAEGVAFANWSERFRGRLAQVKPRGDGRVTLVYRQNTLPLDAPVLSPELRIGRHNFPYAAPDVVDAYAPIIYGSHDSAPYTNLGFVPALLVDTTGDKRHLVSAGAVQVPEVWKNDLQQTLSTHYTVELREIAGRLWTLLEWTSAAAVADDDVIQCNVDGFDDNADGTGTVYTDPADQLEHLLNNFVFGDYKRGAWATSSDQVDAPSFTAAAAYFAARGYSSARRISTDISGKRLLAEWCLSHEARLYWKYPGAGSSGKIAAAIEELDVTDWYSDTWQSHTLRDARDLEIEDSDRLEVDGLAVRAVYDETHGYRQSWSVSELGRTNPAEIARELRWGPAS